MKVILTIAGSDTSAGAGIQQDLKTVTALGQYAVTVPTALTAQNTQGISKIMAVSGDMLRAQLDAILSDIRVDAVKIGMIPNEEAARIIVEKLAGADLPIVYDPVIISTSGTPLMTAGCEKYVKEHLFGLCTLITPNIPEAIRLTDKEETTTTDLNAIGKHLVRRYGCSFLIKGGHAEGDEMRDILYQADGTVHVYASNRIDSRNLHGTGCTLSSAIATLLGSGLQLPDAVKGAKEIIDKGIAQGRELRIGKGNGPLWLF